MTFAARILRAMEGNANQGQAKDPHEWLVFPLSFRYTKRFSCIDVNVACEGTNYTIFVPLSASKVDAGTG